MMAYNTITAGLRRIWNEDGIQHVEEALLLALIAVAAITITTSLGSGVADVFQEACTELTGAACAE